MVDSEVFEVDKIVGKGKDSQGQEMYLVLWKGYDESEATWEPLSNLESVTDLIAAFNKA